MIRSEKFARSVMDLLEQEGSGLSAGVAAIYNEADRHSHQGRRYVAWIHQSGTIVPPRQAGASPNELSETNRLADLAATLDGRVVVWVSAENATVAEQLFHNTIAGIKSKLGNLVFRDYQWDTEAKENAGRTTRNRVVRFTFVLPLPVPADITPLGPEEWLAEAGDPTRVVVGHEETTEMTASLEDP